MVAHAGREAGDAGDREGDERRAEDGVLADPEEVRLGTHDGAIRRSSARIVKLKQTDGPDLTVLGSGQIVAQLEAAGLFDSLQLLIVPVILGAGKSQFSGVTQKPWWKVARSKTFKNGRVFVAYERKPTAARDGGAGPG